MNIKILAVISIAVVVVAATGIYIVTNDDNDSSNDGPKFDENGKVVAEECEEYSITDATGTTYTFDHTFGPAAITACTYGGAFFTLAALTGENLPSYIVGMDVSYTASTDFAWVLDDMPELTQVTDIYSSGTNVTAVVSCEPSVFIDLISNQTKNEASGGLKEKLDLLGIPILYLNYQSEDPDIIAAGIEMIGALYGLNEKAEKLADFYVSKTQYLYDAADSLIKANGGKRPLVYAERGGMSLTTISNSWGNNVQWGALIYNLGGQNLIPDVTYPVATLANILTANPDIMMTATYSTGTDCVHVGYDVEVSDTLAEIEKLFSSEGRIGYSDLDVWTSEPKQFYVVHQLANRNIFGFAVLEFMAQMIWPDEYADLDPAQDLEDFWTEWMPFSYGGCWMVNYSEEKGISTLADLEITVGITDVATTDLRRFV